MKGVCLPIHSSQRRAFTLLEVMLATALLAILASALFLMVQSMLNSAAEVREHGDREEEWTGLTELFRRTFQTLPASASLTTGVREEEGQYFTEVVIRDAPMALGWGESSAFPGPKVVTARMQVGGLVSLDLSNEEERENASPPRWIRLVSDLREVEWRFYDSRSNKWRSEWKDPLFHPSLVELTLTPAGSDNVIRWVFWIPTLLQNPPLTTVGGNR